MPAYKSSIYTYTEQYYDSYINLLWYGSRHYDPEFGHFISPDSTVPTSSLDRIPHGLPRFRFRIWAFDNPSTCGGIIIPEFLCSGQSVQDVRLDFHNVQYLYTDGEFYHFMDNETFEQPAIKADVLGDDALYLIPEMEVKLTFYKGEPLDIEMPTSVDLEVVEAEMAVRGDTATGVTKKVTTNTGLQVQCPQFVKVGDKIRVDTRTGEYVTRV